MFEKEFYISNLIATQLRGELTTAQEDELNAWLDVSAHNRIFYEGLRNDEQFRSDLKHYRNSDKDSVWEKTYFKIKADQGKDRFVQKLRIPWARVGAAAAILMLVSVSIYFYKGSPSPKGNTYISDVAAGNNVAVLTLADGRKISLNDASNGHLAKQAGIVISKTTDGQLIYTVEESSKIAAQSRNTTVTYNTIETPRGGQYQVALPDGSKVWLNSASSIKFPTSFSKLKSRNVQLKGEAYFEVAKVYTSSQRIPFTVTTNNQKIAVLGTHFNVNSYSDELSTKTTLLEGAVTVSSFRNDGLSVHLKPGEQSNLVGGVIKVTAANIEEAMAWKNGYFSFNDENIQHIMRELSRWYNVEVKYEGEISTEGFYAKISRNNNISQVLNALQSTKAIHFTVEGRRVTVTQ